MAITLIGYLLIPIGVFLFFFRPTKWLFYGSVIFSGFSGTAIMIIGGDLGLQPSYFFALLWMIKVVCKKNSLIKDYKHQSKPLIIFMFIATTSILMAKIKSGNITIMNVDGKIDSLGFTTWNITQLAYLWFSFLYYYFIICYYRNVDSNVLKNVKDCFLLGVFLVCVITVYQVLAFQINLPFDVIFRQNVHGGIQGRRVYGPCLEASMLCYYIVCALPLAIRAGKWWSVPLVLLIGFIGIYSYSSSFLLGLILWIIIECVLFFKVRHLFKIRNILLFTVLIILLIVAGLIFRSSVLKAVKKIMVTFAGANVSGLERISAFNIQMNAFRKSPILGVGFGSCRSKDLFSTWLASLGILGFFPLVWFLIKSISIPNADNGIRNANIILWCVMFVSVAEPYNLFIWFLLAFQIISSQVCNDNSVNGMTHKRLLATYRKSIVEYDSNSITDAPYSG